jgi:L-ribulose-5-phosphate 4-epimerase
MLENLKNEVCQANRSLAESGLVILTWGNVSGIDRSNGLVVIKPSGVSYKDLVPELMVVVELQTGKVVGGNLKPSSDTDTHLELYRAFGSVNGIVHTHSTFATIWAQALMSIPAMGTTHADTFYGSVPCTRRLTESEINSDYEAATGRVIVETFSKLDPVQIPGVLVANHGPFAWGISVGKAVQNAIILEEIARMALYTHLLGNTKPISQPLLDKHFLRKHGDNAYYGQK